jgi:metal-responsive CopG/Arc/MetJ family transcriptional regulator
MTDSTKFQITLSAKAMEKLEKLCDEKGVKRSAIIAMAIDILFKEEENRDK